MNTTTALIVNNPSLVSSLTNKDLRKNVTAMLQASAGLNKSTWKYAIALHNIIAGEQFKDDFKNQKAFGTAMDIKESTITKCCKAVDMVINVLPAYGYGLEIDEEKGVKAVIGYSNAYLLGTIDDLPAFMEKYSDTDFSKIGKNQLEKLISLYKKPQKEAVEVEANEVEEVEETETEEVEAKANKGDITANISKGILTFSYRGKNYSVPMKDLKEYIIQE